MAHRPVGHRVSRPSNGFPSQTFFYCDELDSFVRGANDGIVALFRDNPFLALEKLAMEQQPTKREYPFMRGLGRRIYMEAEAQGEAKAVRGALGHFFLSAKCV